VGIQSDYIIYKLAYISNKSVYFSDHSTYVSHQLLHQPVDHQLITN